MSETVTEKGRTVPSSEETIVQMVDARAAEYGDRTVMQSKQGGAWVDVTWNGLAGAYKDAGTIPLPYCRRTVRNGPMRISASMPPREWSFPFTGP
jgi:hypothetical protein